MILKLIFYLYMQMLIKYYIVDILFDFIAKNNYNYY